MGDSWDMSLVTILYLSDLNIECIAYHKNKIKIILFQTKVSMYLKHTHTVAWKKKKQ